MQSKRWMVFAAVAMVAGILMTGTASAVSVDVSIVGLGTGLWTETVVECSWTTTVDGSGARTTHFESSAESRFETTETTPAQVHYDLVAGVFVGPNAEEDTASGTVSDLDAHRDSATADLSGDFDGGVPDFAYAGADAKATVYDGLTETVILDHAESSCRAPGGDSGRSVDPPNLSTSPGLCSSTGICYLSLG